MKTLIVTVAGCSSRFNKELEKPTLKSLYNTENYKNSLIYQILDKAHDIDEFVIVGGYLFNELEEFINDKLAIFKNKITLVNNKKYRLLGSGYSLILGIKACKNSTEEILFVEGDLAFDEVSFEQVIRSPKNVLTVNHELITARKSVLLYVNTQGKLNYLYDTSHDCLQIKEPFTAIYNSAQIWKFINPTRLREIIKHFSEKQIKGTNLEIIQGYFGELSADHYDIIAFKKWFNCNTVDDYRQAIRANLMD